MSTVVELNRLTKVFGKVTAVNEVSFSLEADKIYGLLGRNGAGKTTIMQLLAAQLLATSGEVRVFGETPFENTRVLSQLCFIKENQRYPELLRVVDLLDLSAGFFPHWDRGYADALIEDFQLPLKRRIKKLSRGMISAVGVVVGLASRAPLTIFDEPYLGLDVVARDVFYNRLLEDHAEHPRTIVLSTHLIDEVSRILEHVLVLDQGRLVLNEEADLLRGRAFTVLGSAAKVEAYAAGKSVLGREQFGTLLSVTILNTGAAGVRRQAEELGLETAPVSLQQLIVHLTDGKAERKAVEVR